MAQGYGDFRKDRHVTDPTLFDIGETRPQHRTNSTPYPVGSGPDGETCRTCKHLTHSNKFIKCELMRRYWTGGPGTDIRAKWAACKAWERKEKA